VVGHALKSHPAVPGDARYEAELTTYSLWAGNGAYLIVNLLTPQTTNRQSSASMVEVIDMESVKGAWESSDGESAILKAVPLEKHWILPYGGMEIIDSSSLSNDNGMLPRKPHLIPSTGTNSICSHASLSGSAAVTLADGTVAILSFSGMNGDLSGELPAIKTNYFLLIHPLDAATYSTRP